MNRGPNADTEDGEMTFEEIAKNLGVSRQRACEIFHRAMRKLRLFTMAHVRVSADQTMVISPVVIYRGNAHQRRIARRKEARAKKLTTA